MWRFPRPIRWLAQRWERRAQEHKVYLFPSTSGLIFIAVALALLLCGMIYANNLLLLYALFLLMVMVVVLLQAHDNMQGLLLVNAETLGHGPGRKPRLRAHFLQAQKRPRLGLTLTLQGLVNFHSELPWLPNEERVSAVCSWTVPRRGRYPITRLMLHSRFPLGLVQVWMYLPGKISEVVVYPVERGLELPQQNNGWARSFHGSKEDFDQHRRYNPGDSLQTVDWRRWRPQHLPLIKLYGSPPEDQYHFRWGEQRLPYEEEISQLAKWVRLASRRQLPWEMVLPQARCSSFDQPDPLGEALRLLAQMPEAP